MSDALKDLKDRISELPSEELLRIVTVEFAAYRQEALDIAREELQRRGFSQDQLNYLSRERAGAMPAPDDNRMSVVRFTVFALAVGIITFLSFPAILYYSVIAYGLPASIFISIGYVIWAILLQGNQKKALAFSVGFVPPVVLCLLFYLPAVPFYVGMIMLQFSCFWLIFKFINEKLNRRAFR